MHKKINKIEEYLDTSDLKGFQDDLFKYYVDALDEAAEMAGYDNKMGLPVNYTSIGGRPAPLNPDQFPNIEELDAIRHYYGPQILAEENKGGAKSVAKSIVYPAIHEIGGLFSGDGISQIGPDVYNNAISVLDELSGKDKMPATGFKNRLKNIGNQPIPKSEFGVFAKHALGRAMVPPSFKKEDINLIRAMNTLDIIATGNN